MKRLLYILFVLFSLGAVTLSCSDDDDGGEAAFDNWNDPSSPNYKPQGYNPIRGSWEKYRTSPLDKRHKYMFTSEFKYQEAVYMDEEGRWGDEMTIANYTINDKAFKLDRKINYASGKVDVFPYRLVVEDDETVLYIKYPVGGEVRYTRVK